MTVPKRAKKRDNLVEERFTVLERRLATLETVVRDYCAVLGRTSLIPKPTGDMAIHFVLDDQAYCMDLATVDEIVRMVRLTPLVDSPAICMGMIVVRGFSVPILDIRRRLGLAITPPGESAQIILLNIDTFRFGFIVDDVLGIIRISEGDIEIPPSYPYQSSCVTGIVKYRETTLVLINPLLLLQVEDRDKLAHMFHSSDTSHTQPE